MLRITFTPTPRPLHTSALEEIARHTASILASGYCVEGGELDNTVYCLSRTKNHWMHFDKIPMSEVGDDVNEGEFGHSVPERAQYQATLIDKSLEQDSYFTTVTAATMIANAMGVSICSITRGLDDDMQPLLDDLIAKVMMPLEGFSKKVFINREEDEPFFVLLGRDPQAPGLLRQWANLRECCVIDHADYVRQTNKIGEARSIADKMCFYKAANPSRGLPIEVVLAGRRLQSNGNDVASL